MTVATTTLTRAGGPSTDRNRCKADIRAPSEWDVRFRAEGGHRYRKVSAVSLVRLATREPDYACEPGRATGPTRAETGRAIVQ